MKKILLVLLLAAVLLPTPAYADDDCRECTMPLAEDPGIIGPAPDWWNFYLSTYYLANPPDDNTTGSSVQEAESSPQSILIKQQIDELIGKIGPKIDPYNPEKGNRLIQEF